MKTLAIAILVSAFALGSMTAPSMAQTSACEAKAVSKAGKPLSGAAKTASVNKCMKTYCEANAVSSTGKKLSGAAKTASVNKCMKG